MLEVVGMAFDGDACRVDATVGRSAVVVEGFAGHSLWMLQPNSFPKVGQPDKKELKKYECKS